ncbi:hypothetical protein ACWIGW_15635 [Nocardia brasiliensis]
MQTDHYILPRDSLHANHIRLGRGFPDPVRTEPDARLDILGSPQRQNMLRHDEFSATTKKGLVMELSEKPYGDNDKSFAPSATGRTEAASLALRIAPWIGVPGAEVTWQPIDTTSQAIAAAVVTCPMFIATLNYLWISTQSCRNLVAECTSDPHHRYTLHMHSRYFRSSRGSSRRSSPRKQRRNGYGRRTTA